MAAAVANSASMAYQRLAYGGSGNGNMAKSCGVSGERQAWRRNSKINDMKRYRRRNLSASQRRSGIGGGENRKASMAASAAKTISGGVWRRRNGGGGAYGG
jgi:hypothetical protein